METITTYSEKIPGDAGNYKWAVKFDRRNGYLGITQYDDALDRVLLSPGQIAELRKFLRRRPKSLKEG
jgi:hypothetical protein